jgi:hypothetical protein
MVLLGEMANACNWLTREKDVVIGFYREEMPERDNKGNSID